MLYGSKNACDPMEYTLKGADIKPARLILSDTTAHSVVTARDIGKIARLRGAIECYMLNVYS